MASSVSSAIHFSFNKWFAYTMYIVCLSKEYSNKCCYMFCAFSYTNYTAVIRVNICLSTFKVSLNAINHVFTSVSKSQHSFCFYLALSFHGCPMPSGFSDPVETQTGNKFTLCHTSTWHSATTTSWGGFGECLRVILPAVTSCQGLAITWKRIHNSPYT